MQNKYQGQGLLETVIAIGVIVTGLISVIALVVSNLTTQREAAMRYQAVSLAREGIELVRNVRDSNWLSGVDTWDGLGDAGATIEVIPMYTPGVDLVSFLRAADDADAQIYRNSDGVFVQGAAGVGLTRSPFSRTITLRRFNCDSPEVDSVACASVSEDNQIDIGLEATARVEWHSGSQSRNLEIGEILYDWR